MKVQRIYLIESPSTETQNWLRNQLMSVGSGNGNKIEMSREDANKIVDEFVQKNETNNDQEAMKAEAEEIVKGFVDKVRGEYQDEDGPNAGLRDKVHKLIININKTKAEDIIDVLKQASEKSKVPNNKIEDNLKSVNLQTLRSFIVAFNDDILNPSSRIWYAFGNPSANTVMSSPSTFPLFYNLAIDKSLKLDADYLNNGNSIIYNKNLYLNVKDADDRSELVELDLYDKVDNKELNQSINDKTYVQYISGSSLGKKETTPRATRVSSEVKRLLDNMSEAERINFLSLMFDIDNAAATEVYNRIK